MKTLNTIMLICSFLLPGITSQAQTGTEIMKKYDLQMRSDDQQVDLTMKLVSSKGRERVRTINRKTMTDNADNVSSLIRFLSPMDIKGTGFLSIEYTDRDEDQWLYLPALNKTRRISAADQSDNFMGSDFTYEDIGTEDIDNFEYTILGKEEIDNATCYKIEAKPNNEKTADESGYVKRIIYVDQTNYMIRRVIYFNKKNEKSKILNNYEIELIEDANKWRTHKSVMENLETNNKTILIYNNYRIDKSIDKVTFTKRTLETANL